MRNQADALYSRIITELRDAIYVKQAHAGDDSEIIYVKRNADPLIYVDTYTMKIDQHGVSVFDVNANLLDRFELTDRFVLDLSKPAGAPKSSSSIGADNHQLVDLNLQFLRADGATVSKSESSQINIHSKIPLFRTE